MAKTKSVLLQAVPDAGEVAATTANFTHTLQAKPVFVTVFFISHKFSSAYRFINRSQLQLGNPRTQLACIRWMITDLSEVTKFIENSANNGS